MKLFTNVLVQVKLTALMALVCCQPSSGAELNGPRHIKNYNVEAKDGVVTVMWDLEKNGANLLFLVERSVDGKSYTKVDRRKGYDTTMHTFYYVLDNSPTVGETYYRITVFRGEHELYQEEKKVTVKHNPEPNKLHKTSQATTLDPY